MATEAEFFEILKDQLTDTGEIYKLKSKLRYKILEVLGLSDLKYSIKPQQPKIILLMNYLIKEYLNWIGYKYTSYMLSTETGIAQNHKVMSREDMEEELNLNTDDFDKRKPLILQLVQDINDERNRVADC